MWQDKSKELIMGWNHIWSSSNFQKSNFRYNPVRISLDEVFSKILKKPSILGSANRDTISMDMLWSVNKTTYMLFDTPWSYLGISFQFNTFEASVIDVKNYPDQDIWTFRASRPITYKIRVKNSCVIKTTLLRVQMLDFSTFSNT